MNTVCLIVQNHYDYDIRVRRKAESLVNAGYGVDVIALRAADSGRKRYQLNGVTIYTVGLRKARGSRLRYISEYAIFFLYAFWTVSTLMRTRKYDVVDVNNLPDFLVFCALVAKVRGARVLFDMHEITPEFYQSKYGVSARSPLIRFLLLVERASMAFADHVLTINEPINELLHSRGLSNERSTVVMNSVDEAFFASERHRPPPPGVPLQRPRFVMMYHGTLTSIYGLDIAIDAFALVQDRMPGAELWILGSGPERQNLMNLAVRRGLGRKVRFLGSVRPEDIPLWLEYCDLGVLPTRRDVFLDYSFSNKLSEYIVCGKPVICASLLGIRTYFSSEALQYFEPAQPGDLARQMSRMFDTPSLRTARARQALIEYQPIRWEIMRERYLKVIETLAARCAPVEADRTTALAKSG